MTNKIQIKQFHKYSYKLWKKGDNQNFFLFAIRGYMNRHKIKKEQIINLTVTDKIITIIWEMRN